jgi:tetratricopeptide (TPR) repeat protein
MACRDALSGSSLTFVVLFVLALVLWPGARDCVRAASSPAQQVCDPLADYFLGMEDYPEAINRHIAVVKAHPDNALAHYHLGFAYGVTGQHQAELDEYAKAIDLGLGDWDLFLNLGLLYLESAQLDTATKVLRLATVLGPDRPETHFNLGLVYEQRGMLQQAEQEMLLALRLDPSLIEARNTLGVIYAEEGHFNQARVEWQDLANQAPNYFPAQQNLAVLRQVEQSGSAESAHFAHAP